MDTCTCMGDSIRCSPETITALFCVCVGGVGVCFLFFFILLFYGIFLFSLF